MPEGEYDALREGLIKFEKREERKKEIKHRISQKKKEFSHRRKIARASKERGLLSKLKRSYSVRQARKDEENKGESKITSRLALADSYRGEGDYGRSASTIMKAYNDLRPGSEYDMVKMLTATNKRMLRTLYEARDEGDKKTLKKFLDKGRRIEQDLNAIKKARASVYGTPKSSPLDQALRSTAIIGILGGLVFLSPNLTGNAILGINDLSGNMIGGILIALGIIAGFFLIKNK